MFPTKKKKAKPTQLFPQNSLGFQTSWKDQVFRIHLKYFCEDRGKKGEKVPRKN